MLPEPAWRLLFVLNALGNLGNAVWMLWDPRSWYHDLPASVPDFGPLNEHFVRDLGCMFLTWGILLIWAALRPRMRIPITATLLIWYAAHAAVHVFETARGLVPAVHWLVDLPLVYLPALLLAGMLALLLQAKRTRAAID